MTLDDEPPPVVGVADASVAEGTEGTTGGLVEVQLSKPWARPVRVDYVTVDGYRHQPVRLPSELRHPRRSHPVRPPGRVLVPVAGDHAAEGDEELEVLLGNPVEATLGRDRAVVTVTDDDGPNRPPAPHGGRSPANGSGSVAAPATLSWSSLDPDPADTPTHDVYVGRAFSLAGQQWLAACPARRRSGPALGRRHRLRRGRRPPDRLRWRNAVRSRGRRRLRAPQRERHGRRSGVGALLRPPAGRDRSRTRAFGYDPASNRLIVFGGCRGSCATPSAETWVLANANGLGGAPEWIQLDGTGPEARFGAAAAFDPAGDRLFVHGGAAGESGPTARRHLGARRRQRARSSGVARPRAVRHAARRAPLREPDARRLERPAGPLRRARRRR